MNLVGCKMKDASRSDGALGQGSDNSAASVDTCKRDSPPIAAFSGPTWVISEREEANLGLCIMDKIARGLSLPMAKLVSRLDDPETDQAPTASSR